MEPFDKEEMRQDFGRLGWALIASQLLLMFLTMAGGYAGSALLRLFSPLRGTWSLIQGYIGDFFGHCRSASHAGARCGK